MAYRKISDEERGLVPGKEPEYHPGYPNTGAGLTPDQERRYGRFNSRDWQNRKKKPNYGTEQPGGQMFMVLADKPANSFEDLFKDRRYPPGGRP